MKLKLTSLAVRALLPSPPEPKVPGNPFRPLPPAQPRRLEPWDRQQAQMPDWYRPLALSQWGPEHQPQYDPIQARAIPWVTSEQMDSAHWTPLGVCPDDPSKVQFLQTVSV